MSPEAIIWSHELAGPTLKFSVVLESIVMVPPPLLAALSTRIVPSAVVVPGEITALE